MLTPYHYENYFSSQIFCYLAHGDLQLKMLKQLHKKPVQKVNEMSQ